VTIVDTTIPKNNELITQQNQIEATEINKSCDTELRGLGRSP
jgi:hypothetical protein